MNQNFKRRWKELALVAACALALAWLSGLPDLKRVYLLEKLADCETWMDHSVHTPQTRLDSVRDCVRERLPELNGMSEQRLAMVWLLDAATWGPSNVPLVMKQLRMISSNEGYADVALRVGMWLAPLGLLCFGFFSWSGQRLPASPAANSLAHAAQGPVLVIDDDETFARAISGVLMRKGYSVHVAGSAREGQEKLRANRYEYVLCDFQLGDSNGRELCDRYFDRQDSAKWFIVSGKSKGDALGPGKSRYEFLQKPFSSKELVSRMASSNESMLGG